jgi:hypothetical protein
VDGVDDRSVRVDLFSKEHFEYWNILADSSVNEEYFQSFRKEIENIHALIDEAYVPDALLPAFLKQQYVAATTLLETYLYESLKYLIFSFAEIKESFVSKNKWERIQKIGFSEIISAYRDLDSSIGRILLETSFHDLVKARAYFTSVGIEFPSFDTLLSCIVVRHHLVHRNGKDENGDLVQVEEADVLQVLESINVFVTSLDQQIDSRIIGIADSETIRKLRRKRGSFFSSDEDNSEGRDLF